MLSAPQAVTVTNIGTAALTLGDLGFTGTNADQFALGGDGCSGQVLAPGASCVAEAAFQPSAAGAKVAWLAIPSDDPETPALLVTLRARGAGLRAFTPLMLWGR